MDVIKDRNIACVQVHRQLWLTGFQAAIVCTASVCLCECEVLHLCTLCVHYIVGVVNIQGCVKELRTENSL